MTANWSAKEYKPFLAHIRIINMFINASKENQCSSLFPSFLPFHSCSLCITVSALLCLHARTHNPFLCNWKDVLTGCHNTKMDQMAKYPWGSTSPTEGIKENPLRLSPFTLSHSPPPTHTRTCTHKHTHRHLFTVKSRDLDWQCHSCYLLSPSFVPGLDYNMNATVQMKLDHLSWVSFVLTQKSKKYFLLVHKKKPNHNLYTIYKMKANWWKTLF